MRDKRQEIWDRITLLHLFKEVNQRASISGALQLQKLIFLLEFEGQQAGLRAAHYRFFRYHRGPFSRELPEDVKLLAEFGFVLKSALKPTKRADFVIEYTAEYLNASNQAQRIIELVKDISSRYGKRSGWSLMNMVYKMNVPVFELGEMMKVQDVPTFVDILDPTNTSSLAEPSPFPDDIVSDLEEEFSIPPEALDPENPSFKRTIRNAMDRLELPSTVS